MERTPGLRLNCVSYINKDTILQTRCVPTEENRRNLSLFARKEFQYSRLLSSQRERKASRRREILKGRCQKIFDSNILSYCSSNVFSKGERGKEGTENKRNMKGTVSKDF